MKFRFDAKIAAAVAEETNLPFVTAENKFEALVYLYYFSPLYLMCNMPFHYLIFFIRHASHAAKYILLFAGCP